MATQNTDIKQNFRDRTNGIGEETLKKLNLAVKKEIAGYNSKLKELNECKRNDDEEKYEKVNAEIKKTQEFIKNGELAKKIESDLFKEDTKSDNIDAEKKLTDGFSDAVSEIGSGGLERPNYIQLLILKFYQLNENKINTYKNISPFKRRSDEVSAADPIRNK